MWSFKAKAALGIAGITLLAATAWSVYSAGFQAGESKIQAKWDAEVSAMAEAQARELERAMAKTAELQTQVDQITRSHRNEINRIRREHSAIVDSLRDRPDSSDRGGLPADTSAGVESAGWCTGARLYRDHAAAFAGESTLAAQLQSALITCLADRAEIERALTR